MRLHFLNDIANDAESIQKSIITSKSLFPFMSEQMGELINRIPGSPLLISSLPGKAMRTNAE